MAQNKKAQKQFVEFLKTSAKYLRNNLNNADYVKELCHHFIYVEEKEEKEKKEVEELDEFGLDKLQIDSLEKIYSGRLALSKKNAGFIIGNWCPDSFENLICNTDCRAQVEMRKDFEKLGVVFNGEDNVPQDLSAYFFRIISAISEGEKSDDANLNKEASSDEINGNIVKRNSTVEELQVVTPSTDNSQVVILSEKVSNVENSVEVVINSEKAVNIGVSQSQNKSNSANELEYSLSATDFNYFLKQGNIEGLIKNVKVHKELYVETATYRETLKRTLRLGCVMLTGNPGVGKTMTSEMVAVKMAGLGFKIHYAKGGYDTLYKIRDEVFREENVKRKDFILIDDCMGRAVFDLSKEQENLLQYLIAQVQNNKENKKLLLNSRIRVTQDLNEEYHEDCLNRYDEMLRRGQVVEAQTMSIIERAYLLRNHIFSRLSEEYYEDLSGDNSLEVVLNPNFNPRVVEHATDPKYVVEIQEKGDFYWSLLNAFDNPEAVWERIYDDKQSTPDEAKVLLKSLFSVSQNACDIRICRKIFDKYWNRENSRRAWNIALETQTGSTVKKVREKGYEEISLTDTSFADFLEKNVYQEGSAERNSLKDGVVYVRQITQVYGVLQDSAIKKQMALDGRLENLIYDSEASKILDIFWYIAATKVCRESLKKYFNDRITKFRKGKGLSFYENNQIVVDCPFMLVALISSREMREFYLGGKISRQLYDYLTFYLSIGECIDILSAYLENKDCFAFEYGRGEIEKLIKNAVDVSLSECFSRDMESVEGPVDDSMLEECNIEVNEEIRNRCFESLDSRKQNLPDDLIDFFTKTIKEHEDVDHTDRIKKYGEELEEYEDYDSYEEYEVTPEEINEVKALFSEKFSPRKEILI